MMWPVRPPRPRQQPDPHITGQPAPTKQSHRHCPTCGHLAAHTDCATDCPTCELAAPEEDDR